MKLRSVLVSSEIQKQIDNFKKEGKQLVVVDDWVLSTHKKLINQLNHIYILNRKYQARRNGLRQRDNLSTEELKIAGLPYALGFVKMPVGENVTYIDNNGTISELQEKAHSICSKYVEPTFDDRYKLKDVEVLIANVPQIMSNLKSYSSTNISRDSNN